MSKSKPRRLICLIGLIVLLGCQTRSTTPDDSASPSILIVYEGDPLANVHVRLRESEHSPVLAQAISDIDGVATFTELPSPEPSAYCVSMESVSDGGWILDAKVVEKFTRPIRLNPFAVNSRHTIEIPKRSVISLNATPRR